MDRDEQTEKDNQESAVSLSLQTSSGGGSGETRKRSKFIPKLQEGQYRLPCEWGECDVVSNNMSDIFQHVSIHIHEYVTLCLRSQHSSGICFTCSWRDCGAQILGSVIDFSRHVYFHVFHVRLKCLGAHQARFLGLGTCMLGSQSCNWIPELPENLECSWSDCKIIFDNPYNFYSHVSHHIEEYPDGHSVTCKCQWKGCKTTVRCKYKLKEHLRTHTQEKQVACPTCGGLFCSHTKLADHIMRQANSDSQRYECSHCNRRFATERMLREHMRRHVNNYKCPLCEMTVPSPSALRQHARYKHSDEKPFKCGHCEFSAKSSADLRKHLDCHNVEDQFSCHIADCPFSARSYNSLALHFKKHHQGVDVSSPRYMCHVCNKTFARGYPLTFHLKKKHFFQWPPGHSRFRYKLHADGYLRLQTVRYEGPEVNNQSTNNDILALAKTSGSARVRGTKKNIVVTCITASEPPASSQNAEEAPEEEAVGEATEKDQDQGSGKGTKRKKRGKSQRAKKSRKSVTDSSGEGPKGLPEMETESCASDNAPSSSLISPCPSSVLEDSWQSLSASPDKSESLASVSSKRENSLSSGDFSWKHSHTESTPVTQASPAVAMSTSSVECPPEMLEIRWQQGIEMVQNGTVPAVEQSMLVRMTAAGDGQDDGGASCVQVMGLSAAEYANSAEANLHMLGDVALTSLRVAKDDPPASSAASTLRPHD